MSGPEHFSGGGNLPGAPAEVERRPPTPRIYVASLSDYNAGRLHGEWIEAGQEVELLQEEVTAMLDRSASPGAEEFAIHDYEGFGPLRIDEYLPLETVSLLAAGIEEHGPAFAHWAHALDSVSLTAEYLARFDEFYLGSFASAEEFAQEMLEAHGVELDELGPEELRPYIRFDMEAYARDLSYDHRFQTDQDGQIHVFGLE